MGSAWKGNLLLRKNALHSHGSQAFTVDAENDYHIYRNICGRITFQNYFPFFLADLSLIRINI